MDEETKPDDSPDGAIQETRTEEVVERTEVAPESPSTPAQDVVDEVHEDQAANTDAVVEETVERTEEQIVSQPLTDESATEQPGASTADD